MKKIVVGLLIAVMAVFGASHANAFDVELVPQGGTDLTGQTSFLLDVWFNADTGGNTFGNWQFGLFYDTSELSYSSYTYGTMPSPLVNDFFGSTPTETSLGNIQFFNAQKQGFGPDPTTGSLLLATVAFDIAPGINMPVGDGLADVWFDTTSTFLDGFTVDGTGLFMVPTHPSGDIMPTSAAIIDVAVAPEPISSTLFLVGGATLGFRRFRKKFKK